MHIYFGVFSFLALIKSYQQLMLTEDKKGYQKASWASFFL